MQAERRRDGVFVAIQFAADGAWPATNKANAPIRREFQLPPDRAFSG